MADKGQRSYIAIDLKSFYASVECKERSDDDQSGSSGQKPYGKDYLSGSVSFLEILRDTGPCQTFRGCAEGERSE